MQATPALNPLRNLEALSPKARKILIWTAVFLALPLPWDWVPGLGDLADTITFVLGALAVLRAERPAKKEAQ